MTAMIALISMSLLVAPPTTPEQIPSLRSSIRTGIKTGGQEGIEMISGCVKKGDKYVYTYKITNIGKEKTWLVGSAIPDRATGLSGSTHDIANYYKLRPGKSTTIIVTHKDGPVEYRANLTCYARGYHSAIRGYHKNNGVTISGVKPHHSFWMSGGANGYIPKSMQPKEDD